MVIELMLTFTDNYPDENGDPIEFVHTLSSPDGMEITGGQIFVENITTKNLDRFTFRIDRAPDGKAILTIMEEVEA